jgi:hypothetical protein
MQQQIDLAPTSLDDVINKVNDVTPHVAAELNPAQLIQHWLNVISLEAHLYPHDETYVASYHQLLDVLVQCNLLPLACRVQRDVGGNYLNNEKIMELTEEAKHPDFVIRNVAPIRFYRKTKNQ